MLFGEVALQLKLVTVDQVEEGLKVQDQNRAGGGGRTLGAILHDLGHLDLVQVTRILREMGQPPDRCQPVPGYDIEEIIGRGMSGAVYRGLKPVVNWRVAIKVRAPRCPGDDPEGKRFIAEARLGAQLSHPNIVRLIDAGQTNDYLYHVQEYVDGESLQRKMRTLGIVPEPLCISVGVQMCSALEHARQHGVVHRDVKPANILISRKGEAKLCDLGLAKDTRRSTMRTAEGVLLGSPYYIAPEYAREGKFDWRSDLYSLGVALYHSATGIVPFEGKSALEILEKAVSRPPTEPRTVNPQISRAFSAALLRLLEKRPDDRYQSAAEAAAAFARAREHPDEIPTDGALRRLLGKITGKK